ncbi:MAG: transcription-repair coupling factor, partial [Planctomycetota bacterium]
MSHDFDRPIRDGQNDARDAASLTDEPAVDGLNGSDEADDDRDSAGDRRVAGDDATAAERGQTQAGDGEKARAGTAAEAVRSRARAKAQKSGMRAKAKSATARSGHAAGGLESTERGRSGDAGEAPARRPPRDASRSSGERQPPAKSSAETKAPSAAPERQPTRGRKQQGRSATQNNDDRDSGADHPTSGSKPEISKSQKDDRLERRNAERRAREREMMSVPTAAIDPEASLLEVPGNAMSASGRHKGQPRHDDGTTDRSPWEIFLRPIAEHDSIQRIVQRLKNGRLTYATLSGGTGSSSHVVAAALASHFAPERTVLLAVAHLDDADEAVDELLSMGVRASRFPALEVMPGETSVAPDLLGERLSLVRRLLDGQRPDVIVAPMPALMQAIPDPDRLEDFSLRLSVGDTRGPGHILAWLERSGYQRVDSIEAAGEFAVRGGIIDIFPGGARATVRSADHSDNRTGGTAATRESTNRSANRPAAAVDADARHSTGLRDATASAGPRDDDNAEGEAVPVRLDFFDVELETIAEIDLDTMASDRRLESVEIVGAAPEHLLDSAVETGLWNIMKPERTVVILNELQELTEQGRGYYERATTATGVFGPPAVFKSLQAFPLLHADQHGLSATDPDATVNLPFEPLPHFAREASDAVGELAELAASGRVVTFCLNRGERDRFRELRAEHAPTVEIESIECYLHRGFIWNPGHGDASERAQGAGDRLALVPYHELLNRYHTRRRLRRLRGGRAMDTFLDLKPGDYVVHRDHGIGRFVELTTIGPGRGRKSQSDAEKRRARREMGFEPEYLTIEFSGRSRVHVPVTKIDLVQKYVGGFHGKPPLSTIGGKRWARQKEQVREAVRDLAAEMLRMQAARESQPGIRFPDDTRWQTQFEAEFPYQETDDQISAISEIKKDMQSERPMDRLVCGDVGFGKTEVAIRAAFKAAEYGRQVAVLVPTTVLAEQHARTFRGRFADYPFRVEVLSRFTPKPEVKRILEMLKMGQVDIIVGTHRLLSKDVRFADLGLVIIDEEQRFGVEHKQRLLQFRMTADVLTLSATPIPRTLHMSMLGLRDISSLTTAPLDRRSIVTEVIPFNKQRIKQAIQREMAREGQTFFVHNRVHNIEAMTDEIRQLVPDARVIHGHGQMEDSMLENVMLKFIRHEADVLVSTTIIESGIDIPNANTIIINNAERFGLAELHQLRGRVGRYKHRAYCYLMLSPDRTMSETATKRLKAIEEYSMLGAGFKIAMRDLEIRGAGNLLGAEQSGHIAVVGYEMYCQLLEQEVKELRSEVDVRPIDTEVELGFTGGIPRTWIPADQRRMEAYRRISQARTIEELGKVAHDLIDAYGDPPTATKVLLSIAEIRIRAAHLKIVSIVRHEQDVIIRTPAPDLVGQMLRGVRGSVRAVEPRYPGQPHEVYFRPPEDDLKPSSII